MGGCCSGVEDFVGVSHLVWVLFFCVVLVFSVEVGKLLRRYYAKGLTEYCTLLAKEAANRGSRDDITIILVQYRRC